MRDASSPDNDRVERARVLLRKIHELTAELENLIIPSGDDDDDLDNEIAVGDRVTVSQGTYKDKTGVVTGKRGERYLWITLDNGTNVYKMPHNLRLIQEDA